ncbi:hypothetical protein CSUI_008560 [Cystoisospora suis]|uniref:Uncharacterized protein n=1 Tax=Cystoisospora suis TaxID=483139 RepID=A0A2C6KJ83_9APIC|nr:hypothetical protein CSUI_008560 [Cystoisospora suis]
MSRVERHARERGSVTPCNSMCFLLGSKFIRSVPLSRTDQAAKGSVLDLFALSSGVLRFTGEELAY